jgi:hypothetical protein
MFEADKPFRNIRMKKYERMDAFGVSAIYFIVIILDGHECIRQREHVKPRISEKLLCS